MTALSKKLWDKDTTHFYGKPLENTKWAHWCHEWDGLPLNETLGEFYYCRCFEETEEFKAARELVNPLKGDK
jgi:hypothetical protein